MKVVIHRNGVDYGPYSLAEVRTELARGMVEPEDMAWVEGSDGWVPLAEILARVLPEPASRFKDEHLEAKPAVKAAAPPRAVAANVAAWFLAVLAVLLLLVLYQMRDLFGVVSSITALGPDGVVHFADIQTQQKGSVLSATLKTDSRHPDILCTQVMEQIFDLAVKHPEAQTLQLELQLTDGKKASILVDDLASVRGSRDPKTYANSGHRQYVGTPLVAAGLADASSLAPPSPDDGNTLVGNTYQSGDSVTPRFGVKFIDDHQVIILANGVQAGQVCQYTTLGNEITIPTSCSVLHLRRRGDGLYDSSLDTQLNKL